MRIINVSTCQQWPNVTPSPKHFSYGTFALNEYQLSRCGLELLSIVWINLRPTPQFPTTRRILLYKLLICYRTNLPSIMKNKLIGIPTFKLLTQQQWSNRGEYVEWIIQCRWYKFQLVQKEKVKSLTCFMVSIVILSRCKCVKLTVISDGPGTASQGKVKMTICIY